MKKLLKGILTALAFAVMTALAVLCAFAAEESSLVSFTVTPAVSTLYPYDLIKTELPDSETGALTAYRYYNIYNYDNLTVNAKFSDGSEKSYKGDEIKVLETAVGSPLLITSDQKEADWSAGKHTVRYSLAGIDTESQFTITYGGIKSVEILPLYDIKAEYLVAGRYEAVSDSFGNITDAFIYDLSAYDYDVKITYLGGTTITYPSYLLTERTGYEMKFSQEKGNLAPGKHTAECSIGGVSGQFTFEVVKNDIISFSLYFSKTDYSISFPEDFYTTTDSDGNYIYRPLYDRSKIMAKVIYKNGSSALLPIGELCAKTHSELVIDDSSFEIGEINVFPARLNGMKATLSLEIKKGALPQVKNLTAKADISSAELSWQYDRSARRYLVERLSESKKWEMVKSVLTPEIKISDLAQNTEYTFRVTPYVQVGNTTMSAKPVQITVKTQIAKVADFSVYKVSDTAVKLTWSASDIAGGYELERYRNGIWSKLADITSSSYTISTLSEATTYSFRIRMYILSDDGKKHYGDYSSLSVTTRLSAVKNFTAETAPDCILLSWTAKDTADGYIIEQQVGSDWKQLTKITDNTVNSFKAPLPEEEGEYSFRIKAYTSSDESGCAEAFAEVQKTDIDLSLTASASSDTITLNWTADTTADGYVIEQKINGIWYEKAKIPSPDVTSYTFKNKSQFTAYYYRIKAVKGTASGKYSDVTIKTKLAPPEELTASTTASEIALSWKANTKAQGYVIEQKINGLWYEKAKITSPDTTSYTFTGKTPSTNYYYRIKSFTASEESEYASVTIATKSAAIAPVKDLKASATYDTITLSWTANTKAQGYVIEQKINGVWYEKATISSPFATSYTFTGKKDLTTFYYRIKSVSGTASSDYSYITIKTKLAPPKNLTAVTTSSRITLKWTANTNASYYIIEQKINGIWYEKAKTVRNTITSYTFTGKKSGTAYYYRIKSVNENSSSAYSQITTKTL